MSELEFRHAGRRTESLHAIFSIGDGYPADSVLICAIENTGVTVLCREGGDNASVHDKTALAMVSAAIEGALKYDTKAIAVLRQVAANALAFCREQMAK